MQNVILFACDIAGTFTNEQELFLSSEIRESNKDKYIKSIIESLERIRLAKGADKVIFTFITEEYYADNLTKNVKKITEYLTETVCQDKHFFKRGIVRGINPESFELNYEGYSKPSKVREYAKKLQKDGLLVSYLIFADDNKYNFCGLEDVDIEKQAFLIRGLGNLSAEIKSLSLTIENDSDGNNLSSLGR